MRRAGVVLLGVALLAGCSSSPKPISESDMYARVASFGTPVSDHAKWASVFDRACKDNADSLQMFLALVRASGESTEIDRIGFEHYCPDRLPVFDKASDELDALSS